MPGTRPCLVSLSGLPGVGKTTIARAVSAAIGGIHLRLDTIEAALTTSGVIDAAGGWEAFPGVGYHVAQAVTVDHLAAGHDVVADSVNPIPVTRDSWAECAHRAGARLVDVEVTCSDVDAHRRRVEERVSDLDGLTVPTWDQVVTRDYAAWDRPVLRVDTASGVEPAIEQILAAIRSDSSR